jgi:hypothetical protein
LLFKQVQRYKLKPIKEEVIKLKFTPTERAMYNAYIVNSNIDKLSVTARQLCNDPRLVDELKNELAGCKTPEDIQKTLVSHHKKTMEIAAKKVRFMKYKIKKAERKIKIIEFKRYRKFLKQNGYRVRIDYTEKINDTEFDNKNNKQTAKTFSMCQIKKLRIPSKYFVAIHTRF